MTPDLRRIGLSPRVRGNPPATPSAWPPARSIPACAGEPPPLRPLTAPTRVYPRVCGGTSRRARLSRRLMGLSPRVRGNPGVCADCRTAGGSIPACAGEPLQAVASPARSTVYPRVCGGTGSAGIPCAGLSGLSPRVRGNHYVKCLSQALAWSIPACAGEPRSSAYPAALTAVYPRVCGGTAGVPAGIIRRGGSIPACAGEPFCAVASRRHCGVYPRVCGGTMIFSCVISACRGLSPRVRGNRG